MIFYFAGCCRVTIYHFVAIYRDLKAEAFETKAEEDESGLNGADDVELFHAGSKRTGRQVQLGCGSRRA